MSASAPSGESTCVLCRRSLLTGERPLLYREPKSGDDVLVCPLCAARAESQGWALIEEVLPSVSAEGDDPERTVRRLEAQVRQLRGELDQTLGSLEGVRESSSERQSEIDVLADRLADAEAETAAAQAAAAALEARLAGLAGELEASKSAQAAILRARRREADPVYLAGVAAEVFNRSPKAATIGLLVGLHGVPVVRLEVAGVGLPRSVRIAFAWPEGGREYRVDIDLVARRFDLIDLVPGGDGRLVPLVEPLTGNAEWRDGNILVAPAEPTIV